MSTYDQVVGQAAAVAALRAAGGSPVHAYLLVGPPGSGTRDAAVGFAAQLLCPDAGCGSCAACTRALREDHPDLVVVERRGASIKVDEVREVVRLAQRSPVEGERKVLLLVDFHLLQDAQYPALLKTLEEPPPSTVIVMTAERVPPHLVTIASRCVRIDLGPVPADALAAALMADGVAPDVATRVAAAAGGRLDRARLLASDPGFVARQELWAGVPARLDGTGAVAATLADELLASIDTITEPLLARQRGELAELEERIKLTGERGSGRKELEDEHKREVRRARTDELRFGLGILVAEYRERLLQGGGRDEIEAIRALEAASEALLRNPNEALLLQALLVRLGDPDTARAQHRA